MNPHLYVWRGDQPIGQLWLGDDGRAMGFTYASPLPPMAISNSLPLQSEPFLENERKAHHWFANLLPEEGSRQELVRRLGVADEDFALLAAIGGDCAGALRLLSPGNEGQEPAGMLPVELNQLARWAEGTERYALFALGRATATRLSLAGAQDKVPVSIRDDGIYLPQGSAASSHLLKFAAKSGLVLNELYLRPQPRCSWQQRAAASGGYVPGLGLAASLEISRGGRSWVGAVCRAVTQNHSHTRTGSTPAAALANLQRVDWQQ